MLTTSLVLFAIGIMAILCGENFFDYLLKIAGGIILATGIAFLIVKLVKLKQASTTENAVILTSSAFIIVCGSLIIAFAEQLVNIFAIILGIVILVGSIGLIITNLTYGAQLKVRSRFNLWVSIFIFVATAILGVYFISNPDAASKVLAIFLGCLLILLAILFFKQSLLSRKIIKEYNKNVLSSTAKSNQNDIEEAIIIEETRE